MWTRWVLFPGEEPGRLLLSEVQGGIMKIAVIGAGLMGPILAKDCIESDEVSTVCLIDIDEKRLTEVTEVLGNPEKLSTLKQSVLERENLVNALKGYDVAAVALPFNDPYRLIENAWGGAIEAGVDVVDLEGPGDLAGYDPSEFDSAAKKAGITIIPGCGFEPGLVEMLSVYGMDLLDTVELFLGEAEEAFERFLFFLERVCVIEVALVHIYRCQPVVCLGKQLYSSQAFSRRLAALDNCILQSSQISGIVIAFTICFPAKRIKGRLGSAQNKTVPA